MRELVYKILWLHLEILHAKFSRTTSLRFVLRPDRLSSGPIGLETIFTVSEFLKTNSLNISIFVAIHVPKCVDQVFYLVLVLIK